MTGWTVANMPDQSGRVAVVTGANTGLGFETALALALKGATVVLACRNEARGSAALERIRARVGDGAPTPCLRMWPLDLARPDSIRVFAQRLATTHDRLDLLINNAGVIAPPLTRTPGGVEMQMAVNHMGHYALTGLLLGRLESSPGARVVTVASVAHRRGRIDFGSFGGEGYGPFRHYNQSKLANLLFALELQRRLAAAGSDTLSVAAHPGWVPTELQRHNPVVARLMHLWCHDAESGARPTLYAATGAEIGGGAYVGPDGFRELRGPPGPARLSRLARDRSLAARLWSVSETMTGVRYAI